eukprot:TRINITY_DN55929_c0_g1_i1.p1 TRINITY_DN55929_c0_g1~~TRINITY_DN55929_c0_g1_i1.p1  ORF type:complete len:478 (-),score=92.67 TRINITY_DN55929_c0_g1_i1:266-1699(-)
MLRSLVGSEMCIRDRDAIVARLTDLGAGESSEVWRMRDWLVSRQRRWGTPIPIVHCHDCGEVPVPDNQLPIEPAPVTKPGQDAEVALSQWAESVACPSCGGAGRRETDTMDTFVDSSWYFLRYCDAGNSEEAFAKHAVDPWLPVPRYVGGIEHAILHLLYARFMTHALHHLGLVGHKEPFKALLAQGMVLGTTHKCKETGQYLQPHQLDLSAPGAPLKTCGGAVTTAVEKMSKSKYNGVEPGEVVREWGADTARLFVLFKAPPAAALEWDDRAIAGQHRWLQRIWTLVHQCAAASPSEDPQPYPELRTKTHKAIQQLTRDLFETQSLNTAVAGLMTLSNELSASSDRGTPEVVEGVSALLTMLAPFAPHAASEMWRMLSESQHALPLGYCRNSCVHEQIWPEYEEELLRLSTATVVIQVGGKTRGSFEVPADLLKDLDGLEETALGSDVAKKWIFGKGKKVRRTIIPKGAKLINFVV